MDTLIIKIIPIIITNDNFLVLRRICKYMNNICSQYIDKNLVSIISDKYNCICTNIPKAKYCGYLINIYRIARSLNLSLLIYQSSINIFLYYNRNIPTVEEIISNILNDNINNPKYSNEKKALINCQELWLSTKGIPSVISDMISNNMSLLFTEEQYYRYIKNWDNFRIWYIHYSKYMFSDHPYIHSLLIVIKSCYMKEISESKRKIIMEASLYPHYVTVFRYILCILRSNNNLSEFVSHICTDGSDLIKLFEHL